VWLAELGMFYYKARIYSPRLGRFLQTDPIGYKDNNNLYAYVANDPVNGVDPTGMAYLSGGTYVRTFGLTNGIGNLFGRSGNSQDTQNLRERPTVPSETEGTGQTRSNAGTIGKPAAINPVTANPGTIVVMGALMVARTWYGILTDEDIDQWRVGYHYTNAKGYKGFLAKGQLDTNRAGKVYFTHLTLPPAEVEKKIFIGNPAYRGRGDYVITFAYNTRSVAGRDTTLPGALDAWIFRIPVRNLDGNIRILSHGANPF